MTDNIVSSTHPHHTPTTEDDLIAWLRLLRSRRVGPQTFHRLLRTHGTAQAALAALPDVAAAAGVENYRACPEGVAEAELRAGTRAGARLILKGMADYPAELAEIGDAPPMLWMKGDASLLTRPRLSVVGARNASSLGGRMARAVARELGAEGFVIVSGLARGIDAIAHEAALDTGTVAVMAGGIDVIYPTENTLLAERIAETGLLISEQPVGTRPQARHFPPRNRIVSGLSPALVVVEAAARSGSLITARAALDQGRDVLAVPGHPLDPRAAGGNMLIRDGARLVRNAADIIEALPHPAPAITELPAPAPERRSLRETAALHQHILDRLGAAPLGEDQLIRDLGVGSGALMPALVDLELSGDIERQPGGLLCRTGRAE